MNYQYQQSLPQEIANIATATRYEDLRGIALEQLKRMYHMWFYQHIEHNTIPPIGIVCGPITNGGIGKGDSMVNLRVFGAAVAHFQGERNGLFFSQMPFEDKIGELKRPEIISLGKPVASQRLLDVFYKPLFESKLIGKMHFLPGWQSSDGASWERLQGERLGIAIDDIPEEVAATFHKAA